MSKAAVPSPDKYSQDYIFHAFSFVRFLSENLYFDQMLQFQADFLRPTSLYGTSSFYALHWIMARDWWHRIWTVQESVLPGKAIILYGPVEAPWSMLLNAADNYQQHSASCCSKIALGFRYENRETLTRFSQTLNAISRLHRQRIREAKISLAPLLREFRSNSSNRLIRCTLYFPLSQSGMATSQPFRTIIQQSLMSTKIRY